MLIFHILHLQQDLEGNLRESKQSSTVRGLNRSVSHGTGLTLENVVIRAESEGAVIQFYDKNDDLIATHDYSKVEDISLTEDSYAGEIIVDSGVNWHVELQDKRTTARHYEFRGGTGDDTLSLSGFIDAFDSFSHALNRKNGHNFFEGDKGFDTVYIDDNSSNYNIRKNNTTTVTSSYLRHLSSDAHFAMHNVEEIAFLDKTISLTGSATTTDGAAAFKIFSITGNFKAGNKLIARQIISDPDGDGSFEHSWQASAEGKNSWSSVGSGSSFIITRAEEGNKIRLKTTYVDADGFDRSVISEAVSIPASPDPVPTPNPTPAPVPTPTPEPTLAGHPPNLINGILKGKTITLQFDDILSKTLPSSRKFTLIQGNRKYQITSTQTFSSDGIVVLTAEKELDPTVLASLEYLDFSGDQTTGVIESSTGVDLESFTGFALDNQGSQENSLTIDEGEFDGNQITLFLSAPISEAVPSKSRFKVKSANKNQKILTVSTEPDDGIITITTKKNLDLQESILVSYRDLGGDQVDKVIEDLAGNDMATIKDFEIISGGNDAIAPMVASATLDENMLSVEFDSIIRNTKISKNRFKVKINGKKVRVLSAKVEQDDSYVELALKPKNLRKIDLNSSVTLSYTDPKGDQTSKVVEDVFGNDLDSFSGYGVEIVKI